MGCLNYKKVLLLPMKVWALINPEYRYWKNISHYYKIRTGKKLNYKHPQDINEKLLWLAYYYQNPLIVKCADKVRMRDYVEQCGLGKLLIPIYGIWNNADDIDFEKLPSSFVLKCNHGCAMNVIVRDKRTIEINAIRKTLNMWLATSYGEEDFEHHYSYIHPLVYCEQLLPFEGKSVVDYKLHCINGKPHSFFVCTERDVQKNTVTFSSYSLKWGKLNQIKNESDEILDKPKCIKEMQDVAQILAKPFPYVRLDFYEIEGKLFIGEMTFSPHGNIMEYYKDEFLLDMGREMVLPTKKYKGYIE